RVTLDERESRVFEQLVRARLQMVLDELRLVVEEVVLRRGAGHVQINDALHFRRKVRWLRRQWRAGSVSDRRIRSGALADERRQRDCAKPGLAALEELPAGVELRDLLAEVKHPHPFVNTPSRFSNTFATTVHAANSAAS